MILNFLNPKVSNSEIANLLVKIFSSLPSKFKHFAELIDNGLLVDYKKNPCIKNGYRFILEQNLLAKHELRDVKGFKKITGIKVFDKLTDNYILFEISIANNIPIGFSTPYNSKFMPDTNKVDTSEYFIENCETDAYQKIKHLLTKSEAELIDPSDVYSIVIKEKMYYSIKELQDGNFIGIDENKKVYYITHDPYEVSLKYQTITTIFTEQTN